MPVINSSSRTRIDEISENIYRISTPLPPGAVPGGFTFNQYLILDEEPLLFHTGSRSFFPMVAEAIKSVVPLEKLKYIGFSHYEQDECGSLNELLAQAPHALPLCSMTNAMINGDGMDRSPHVMKDQDTLSLGKHTLRWFDTPHLPHGWECGLLMDETTGTFFCGDLFTHGGDDIAPLTEADILGPSEAFRQHMDYFAHSTNQVPMLEKLASLNPKTLACMHGSAWSGNGKKLLLDLAGSLQKR